jgi:5-oxoprolinase (ATP-hydrolysing)
MTDFSKIRFSIDRGGTFTDIYAEIPGKPGFRVLKLLSEDPQNYEDAPREGIRRILTEVTGSFVPDHDIDAAPIEWIRMGTTIATNALLERKGARCALVVTKGFADILEIGNQNRPDLFDLEIKKPKVLYEKVIEANERIRLPGPNEDIAGKQVVTGQTGDRFLVMDPLDIKTLGKELKKVRDDGIDSLAVVLMHGYAWDKHELAIGRLARELGFSQISLSCRVMPKVKLVARGDTTMVDAYLNPCIRNYLDRFCKGFKDKLKNTRLLFMQSDGGLCPAENFTGSRAILSGPAGGVVGYAMTAQRICGSRPVIGFDMGGTSTDVSRFDNEFEMVFETETAGVRIQAPQLNIRTVAAGGGSRLFFENSMLMVGPQSAGAHPGPVCYRKGGYLTVTDANLVLGRIEPGYFPRIFGPGEDQPLDREASKAAMAEMARKINAGHQKTGASELSMEQAALGFVQVANETMARAIREISVMRGFDIQTHVLACFGGAGPQHACAIARILGIREVFIHRFAGILSACGMGMADVVVERQQPASAPYEPGAMEKIENALKALEIKACRALYEQGFDQSAITATQYLNLRYQGTDTAMMIARPESGDFAQKFHESYVREFGFDLSHRPLLIDDMRVRARGKTTRIKDVFIKKAKQPPKPVETTNCFFESGWMQTLVFEMAGLRAGHRICGPALIIQDTATVVVEPGCTAEITGTGDISIKLGKQKNTAESFSEKIREGKTGPDPVQLSVFSNRFMSVAEQMGRMLQKTSISTNIKERLDFSCALFAPNGDLVANAPHVPVHLGAMSEAVKAQIRICVDFLRPGDVLVSNHPKAGGSHLPDITVITPVFDHQNIIFWVASRGHHADIGGICPGSMPPDSRMLWQEGACIQSFKLVTKGRFQEAGIRKLLVTPAGPGASGTRRIEVNLSDLRAQVAANQKGIDLLGQLVDQYGLKKIQAYMGHVQDAAEVAIRKRLCELSHNRGMAEKDTVHAKDFLDDGSPIVLALTIDRRQGSAVFDFSGTGQELWGNCNAPSAVTTSAVLYCLRCLIKKELPLNQGCLAPVQIHIPPGCLLAPSAEAAVAGGNVLTSQRVVDVVLKAFGVAAASQGCMNNITFGNEHFGYYETIGGGAGAGPDWHGADGVHTHMTNTRITDPEIIERRYPVLLQKFAIRKNSGGKGKYCGGNGLIREIEFLAPLSVAVLTERRVFAPYGLKGGAAGSRGQNLFIRKNGAILNLGSKNQIQALPGDRLFIATPGGGGFGRT